MFGSLGGTELLAILVLALLLFGPRRLPEIGRTLGRTLQQLRRAATDFRADLEREVRIEDAKDAENSLRTVGRELKQEMRDLGRSLDPTAAPPPGRRPQAAPEAPAAPSKPAGSTDG